jgi:hypothetical protein
LWDLTRPPRVASIVCFALYFPIGSALITLLRGIRAKSRESLPNKGLEQSAPRQQ